MVDEVLRARLAAQGLTARAAAGPEEVVGRLLAVQGQDPRGFRLAVRARSAGLAAADADTALDAGRLVVGWLNRGTLHLVRREDYWDLFALTTPPLGTGNRRRLAQEGVTPRQAEHGVAVVEQALAVGPATRAELRDLLAAADVPVTGQALVHVLYAASLRGLLVRGPLRGREQAFVDPRTWIGPPPATDREAAAARLAARYLVGHGPASAVDLSRWSGLPLGAARRALTGLGERIRPVGAGTIRPGDPVDGLVDLADRTSEDAEDAEDLPAPVLLGSFDPVLHGWADRSPITGSHADVVTMNGIFRPTLLVGGRVIGTWTLDGRTLLVTVREPLDEVTLAAVRADAADVLRYLGTTSRVELRDPDGAPVAAARVATGER
jgi:hypothetical protein